MSIISTSQKHLSWVVQFKTEEGKEYTANQLYFVTDEIWTNLKAFVQRSFKAK